MTPSHIHPRKICATAIALLLSAFWVSAADTGGLDGLCNEQLKEAVAIRHRPRHLITGDPTSQGKILEIWNLHETDCNGNPINHFSEGQMFFTFGDDFNVNVCRMLMADPSWWEAGNAYGDTLRLDLHNTYPALLEDAIAKDALLPGTVTDLYAQNGFWKTGYGALDEQKFPFWEPPESLKGDVARIMFYMSTVYSRQLPDRRNTNCLIYFTLPEMPKLSSPAAAQLLEWHRSDPVDDYEAKRNEIIMQYQGNSNPFVDSPDLAEYLWGSKAGMPYATDGPGGSDDSPLRPSYRISDPRINLHSPYIPADASWKVDDTDVSEPYLSPSELGTGTHRLDYSSSTRKGTMLIEITE